MMREKAEEFARQKEEFRRVLKRTILGKKPHRMEFWRDTFFDPQTGMTKEDIDHIMNTMLFPEDIEEGYGYIGSMFNVDTDLNELRYDRSRRCR